MKTFGTNEFSPTSIADIEFPAFSQVKLPDDFTAEDRKRVFEKMTVKTSPLRLPLSQFALQLPRSPTKNRSAARK
jgi:hypothetical protein